MISMQNDMNEIFNNTPVYNFNFFFRFILASFYTKYDLLHFLVNTVALASALIPKLPQLHKVRLFGINRY
jgi:hypothetical protein